MVQPQTVITQSAQETARLGKELADTLLREGSKATRVICLYGQLGAGKTTFAQGFAKGFGVTTRLLSPTFIIVRRYQLSKPYSFLYHVDLYRIRSVKEVEDVGLAEILLDLTSFIVIEWAERMKSLLPKERIDIHFAVEDSGEHTIIIEGHYGAVRS